MSTEQGTVIRNKLYVCRGGYVFIGFCLSVCLLEGLNTEYSIVFSQNSVERWHMLVAVIRTVRVTVRYMVTTILCTGGYVCYAVFVY